MGYRNYSDEDKATALAYLEACNNLTMAARECRVPVATLSKWRDERDRPSSPPLQMVQEKREAIADRLEGLVHQLLDAVPGKIDGAPLAATYTSVGISVDKMRLLREQPTSIVQQPQTVEERDRKALELMQKVQLRMVNGGAGEKTA